MGICAQYGECSEETLANVHTLSVMQTGSTNVANLLTMIVPLCRNVEFVCAQFLTEDDIPWILALAEKAPRLKHLHLHFKETPDQFAYLLQGFQMCGNLETVELNDTNCMNIVHDAEFVAAHLGGAGQRIAASVMYSLNQFHENSDEMDDSDEYDEYDEYDDEVTVESEGEYDDEYSDAE